LRPLLGWAAVAAILLAILGGRSAVAITQVCTCATVRAVNGWCDVHQFGWVGGVKVTSRWLYDAADAHGHQVDPTTFPCPDCQRAIAIDGFCPAHRIGFVNKLAYFSRLTYELARGEVRRTPSIPCAACRKNAEAFGWCARDKVGMVGEVAFKSRADYDEAVKALQVFIIANDAARRCERCAVAILTDTTCPVCRIAYKNGRAVEVP